MIHEEKKTTTKKTSNININNYLILLEEVAMLLVRII